MAVFIAQNLAPIMFATLVIVLLMGYPVAFSLGAVGLAFFVIAVELAPLSDGTITLSWPLLQSLPERIYGIMRNDTLLAIPFFTFMGLILQRSGMAEDLLETVGQLFGTVRGGLALAVVLVGGMLAATTGVVAASVISMGLISLPIMLRYGYDRRLASGVIAASGTLAQIVPPSLVLIVLADQMGRSVGDMYVGALIPGLVLVGLYVLYVATVAFFSPSAAPGLPDAAIGFRKEDGSRGLTSLIVLFVFCIIAAWLFMRQSTLSGATYFVVAITVGTLVALVVALINYLLSRVSGQAFLSPIAQQVTFVLVPPLLLIFLVLGTIFLGVATPTEGGAMGAVGACLLALIKRGVDKKPERFNFEIVRSAAEATAKLSAFVMFILIGARIFSLTFYGVNGHVWVEHLLTNLPGGQIGFLVFINVVVFLLAFFLDFFELAFIIVPLLAPVATALGIDLIWFGVMLAVNMQTSFMHPPFGFALFYLRSVAPKETYRDTLTGKDMAPVTTGQIYWGAIPFLIIQIIMIGLVIAFPQMVLHYKDQKSSRPAAPHEATSPSGYTTSRDDLGLSMPPGSPFGGPPDDPAGGLKLPATPPQIGGH